MNYDIRNPTQARRVIYDGIERAPSRKNENGELTRLAEQTRIVVEAGEAVENVPLADHVADQLKNMEGDLLIRPSQSQPSQPQQHKKQSA
jgi:hypothetical protein